MIRQKIRIAIDGRPLTGRYTGDRTYWLNLIRSLVKLDETESVEFLIYSRTPIAEGQLPESSRIRQIVLPAANDRIWTFVTLPLALRRERVDLLHVQYTTPIPWLCSCPVITTVHDITFKLFPEWYSFKDRTLLNLTVPISMKLAAKVITDSKSSREDILKSYRIAPEKVAVTLLGLPEEFVLESNRDANERREVSSETRQQILEKYGIVSPFVLSVGVLQPRKNNLLLIEAFARAKARFNLPHKLYLVGKLGWKTQLSELTDLARECGGDVAAESVVFPGYVEDADLPTLYRMCDLFAHPALYEGFGIPPLEAMACGATVLSSDAPALPEVVGDAAKTVAARSAKAWEDAIGELLQDAELRNDYSAKGLLRSKLFRWEETAKRTFEIYLDVIRQATRR